MPNILKEFEKRFNYLNLDKDTLIINESRDGVYKAVKTILSMISPEDIEKTLDHDIDPFIDFPFKLKPAAFGKIGNQIKSKRFEGFNSVGGLYNSNSFIVFLTNSKNT